MAETTQTIERKYELIDTIQQLRESLSPITEEQTSQKGKTRQEIEEDNRRFRSALKMEIQNNSEYGEELHGVAQDQVSEAQNEFDQAHNSTVEITSLAVENTLNNVEYLLQLMSSRGETNLLEAFNTNKNNIATNSGITTIETTIDRLQRVNIATQDLTNKKATAVWIQSILE
jgi:hypothetical protein